MLGFVLFFVAAAIATIASWFLRPLRSLFPVAWRAWLFGSVGFVCGNAALFGILWLLGGTGSFDQNASWAQKTLSVTTVAAAVVGPFVASALGLGFGVLVGCLLGLRYASQTKSAA